MDNFPDIEYDDNNYYVEKKAVKKRFQPTIKTNKLVIMQRGMELLREGYMTNHLLKKLEEEFGISHTTSFEYLSQVKQEIIADFEDRRKMQTELLMEELYQLKNKSDDKWFKLAVIDRIIKITGIDKPSESINQTDTTFTIELYDDTNKDEDK